MTAVLAQIPEAWMGGLAQGGVLAVIIGVLLWRDMKRDEKRDEADARRDEKMDNLSAALNNLTRALTLEVLTRPTAKRIEDEARDIHQAVTPTR